MPLAMNAQNGMLKRSIVDSSTTEMNGQNEMFTKSSIQIPNLELRNFNTLSSPNVMSGRGSRDAQYELVTSSQSDWSGNYVLVGPWNSTTGYAFDGDVDAEYHQGGITAVTID